MAGDLTETIPAPPEPAKEPRLVLHRRRFLAIYALVGAAVAAGVLGFFLLVGGGPLDKQGPKWSAWKPHGGGLGAAKEIAAHVGVTYHLASGSQLLDVIAKSPIVSAGTQEVPLHYVATRGAKGATDLVAPVSSSDTVIYSLCGLGPSCAIATGKASVARGMLVRREALELALYTFKYVGGVKQLVAFVPPTLGSPPQYAIYLQKSDLAEQLRSPLARTLSANVPGASSIPVGELQTIDSLLVPHTFRYSLTPAQTGDAILVLTPFKA